MSPRYSRWTEKRMVKIEDIWPDRLLDPAIPAGGATGPGEMARRWKWNRSIPSAR